MKNHTKKLHNSKTSKKKKESKQNTRYTLPQTSVFESQRGFWRSLRPGLARARRKSVLRSHNGLHASCGTAAPHDADRRVPRAGRHCRTGARCSRRGGGFRGGRDGWNSTQGAALGRGGNQDRWRIRPGYFHRRRGVVWARPAAPPALAAPSLVVTEPTAARTGVATRAAAASPTIERDRSSGWGVGGFCSR